MAEKRTLVNSSGTANGNNSEVLAKDTKRQYLLIQNKSDTENLFVAFDQAATIANGLVIYPNTAYEPPYEVISGVNLITEGLDCDYVIITA